MICVGYNVVLYGGKSDYGIVLGDDNFSIYDSVINKWRDCFEVKGIVFF